MAGVLNRVGYLDYTVLVQYRQTLSVPSGAICTNRESSLISSQIQIQIQMFIVQITSMRMEQDTKIVNKQYNLHQEEP